MEELHDIDYVILNEGFVPDEFSSVSLKDLKFEAIQHIKAIGQCRAVGGMYNEGVCGINGFICTECNYKLEYLKPWIMSFFKITEEDLK